MKRIIIIGASSGLGAKIASDFASAGWDVGVAARREERLKALKATNPQHIVYTPIDVTAANAVEEFHKLIELNGGMDVLLYAAGVGFQDPDIDTEKLDNTIATNVNGYARILTAAYKYFRDSKDNSRKQIAAITSIAGTKGIGISAAYSSTKRFEQIFMDSLEQLAHTQNVNVCFTDIRPGFIRTDLLNSAKKYPMLMSVDYVCPKIERAILKRKRRVVVDWRWSIVVFFWKLTPNFIWKRLKLNM